MTTDRPKTACVLSDWTLNTWQVRSLRRLQHELNVDIPLVAVDRSTAPNGERADAVTSGIGSTVERLATNAIERRAWSTVVAERKIGAYLGDEHPLRQQRSVAAVDCFDDADIRRVTPVSDGVWNELPVDTVDDIAAECDVVVRYGFGLIRGDILEEPEYGVLSFHPADIRRYRGMGTPKAFLDDRSTVGATLQRLNDEIDAGEIIAEGEIDRKRCDTLWDLYDRQEALQIELLVEGVRNLRDPAYEPTVPDTLGSYTSPDRKLDADFAIRTLAKNLRGRICSLGRGSEPHSRVPSERSSDEQRGVERRVK